MKARCSTNVHEQRGFSTLMKYFRKFILYYELEEFCNIFAYNLKNCFSLMYFYFIIKIVSKANIELL